MRRTENYILTPPQGKTPVSYSSQTHLIPQLFLCLQFPNITPIKRIRSPRMVNRPTVYRTRSSLCIGHRPSIIYENGAELIQVFPVTIEIATLNNGDLSAMKPSFAPALWVQEIEVFVIGVIMGELCSCVSIFYRTLNSVFLGGGSSLLASCWPWRSRLTPKDIARWMSAPGTVNWPVFGELIEVLAVVWVY